MESGKPLENFSEAFKTWNFSKPLEQRADHGSWNDSLQKRKDDGYRPQCELNYYDPIWHPHHQEGSLQAPHVCQPPPIAAPYSQPFCLTPRLALKDYNTRGNSRRMIGHIPNQQNQTGHLSSAYRLEMPSWRPPSPCSGPDVRLRWLVDFKLDNLWPHPLDPPPQPTAPSHVPVCPPSALRPSHSSSSGPLVLNNEQALWCQQKENTGVRRAVYPPWIRAPPPAAGPNEIRQNDWERVGTTGLGLQHVFKCRPPMTYITMIERALAEKGPLTVAGIYTWVSERYPFFKVNDDKWKNSIRHNLSLNPQFYKGSKCDSGGHVWHLVQPGQQPPPQETPELRPPTIRGTAKSRGQIKPSRGRGQGRGRGRGRGRPSLARSLSTTSLECEHKAQSGKRKRKTFTAEHDVEEELRKALKSIQQDCNDNEEERQRLLSASAQRILFGYPPNRSQGTEDRVKVESVQDHSEPVVTGLPWNDALYY